MSLDDDQLNQLRRVVDFFKDSQIRVVFAESCTSGLVAALLGHVPGVSNVLCGSMVVYRAATKSDWLELDPKMLDDPSRGTVCRETTRELAVSVLQSTPEANWSAAVTGHLGPGAPPELDGTVFVAVAARHGSEANIAGESRIQLTAAAPVNDQDIAGRARRQSEAAWQTISFLEESIKMNSPR